LEPLAVRFSFGQKLHRMASSKQNIHSLRSYVY